MVLEHLRQLLALGEDFVDAVGIHGFAGELEDYWPGWKSGLQSVRTMLDWLGHEGVEIWIDEVGLPATTPEPPCALPPGTNTDRTAAMNASRTPGPGQAPAASQTTAAAGAMRR